LGNPVEAIKEEMEILAEVAEIFILLTHQGADLDYALAEKIDGLDVIVGSHSQSPIDKPEEVNGTLIVQAGKEGYYVGIAELIINGRNIVSKSGRIDTMKFGMPDDERVMKFIHDYEDKSGRINRQKLKEKK
jgi:5'-nucleotidase/UDP-sugar diphosphatase